MSIFEKFDKEMDIEALKNDVQEASTNSTGNYEEVPKGEYEVKIEQMEMKLSKKGDPMLSIWFKIVNECKFKNSIIFMNQLMVQGFQIHIVNELLRALTSELKDVEIKFESYSQYEDLVLDVFEEISGNFEYALDYGENKKGFSTFKIKEVFALD